MTKSKKSPKSPARITKTAMTALLKSILAACPPDSPARKVVQDQIDAMVDFEKGQTFSVARAMAILTQDAMDYGSMNQPRTRVELYGDCPSSNGSTCDAHGDPSCDRNS